MGRYSKCLAPLFADFAGLGPLGRVLDVGAGAGALTAVLASRVGAGNVAAVEPSERFAAALDDRVAGVDLRRARAEELPWEDASFDYALAQLVIGFVGDAAAATAEMVRVVRPGGVVALCMWDEGGLEFAPPLQAARQAAAPLDVLRPPRAQYRSEQALAQLLVAGGLRDVETTILEVMSEYASFGEFWCAALGVVGPDTAWMRDLDDVRLEAGRKAAYQALGRPLGSFTLRGRAVAARAFR